LSIVDCRFPAGDRGGVAAASVRNRQSPIFNLHSGLCLLIGCAAIAAALPATAAVAETTTTTSTAPATKAPIETQPVRSGGGAGNLEQEKLGDTGANWVRDLIQTAAALAAVVAVLLLLRYLLKRLAMPTAKGRLGAMEVLGRLAVAPRQYVLLVRLGRRMLLIGASGGEMQTLTEITDPAESAELAEAARTGRWPPGAEDAPPAEAAPERKEDKA
jgi:flagellar protein FliO/FliZ